MNDRPLLSPEARKWLPAAAAGGLLAIVVVAGVALGGGGGDESAPAVTAESVAFANSVPASVDVIATVETAVPVTKTVLSRTLSKGMAGDDVAEVQQRLTDLGFWPGPIDGYFGDETRRSVWAYEKLVLGVPFDEPTGAVTPDMWTDMQDPFVIQPRRTDSTPNHTEIYLPEQVIAVFQNDVPVMISHMSSGDNEDWCEEVTISPGEYNNPGDEPLVARRVRQVDHTGRGLQLHADGRRCPSGFAGRHVGSGVLQLRDRRARCAQRAAAARLARLHPHPVVTVAVVPGSRVGRRPGLRVRRREGAGGVRRPEAVLQPHRPRLLDHDVVDHEHHHDHDDAGSTLHHGAADDHAARDHDDRRCDDHHHAGAGRSRGGSRRPLDAARLPRIGRTGPDVAT